MYTRLYSNAVRVALLVALAVITLTAVRPQAAYAAAFVVNDVVDAVDAAPGDGVCATAANTCSLRAAIQESNALAGADTVTLPAGTYQLTIAGANENAAATGDLDITGGLTLTGAGAGLTTIDASTLLPGDRVLHVIQATVTVSRLKLTGGRVAGSGGGLGNASGNVTLQNVMVDGNTAEAVGAGGLARGGGIYNNNLGTLTLNMTTVSNNTADGNDPTHLCQGGGLYNEGTITLRTSTVENNSVACDDATLGEGGGLYNSGLQARARLIGSTFSGNAGQNAGGGVRNLGGGLLRLQSATLSANTTSGNGGGLANASGSTASISRSILADNEAPGGYGGGLYNEDGTVNMDNTTISGNLAESGGGVYTVENAFFMTLTFLFVTVSNNQATDLFDTGGGGLYAYNGTVTINLSTFDGNSSDTEGGAAVLDPDSNTYTISQTTFSNNSAVGDGGAVYYLGSAGGAANITRSAVYGNSAANGGGIALNLPTNFNMTILKSTLSGNSADLDGGGLYLRAQNNTFLSIAHLTVVENTAANSGGGIYVANALVNYPIYHVLLSENSAAAGPNCDGFTLTSTGFNLLGNNSGCAFANLASDQVGTVVNPIDPLIGPLQDNGGPTWTHELLTGSPAIETGHVSGCTAGGASDQRVYTQPADGNNDGDPICDIGAFEKQP